MDSRIQMSEIADRCKKTVNKYRIYVPSLVVMELLQGAKIIQKAMGLQFRMRL